MRGELSLRCKKLVESVLSRHLERLVEERGWVEFTEAQKLAIPEVKAGKNVLLIAPTGIGKTEAALLPILDMALQEDIEPVAILYITPLRALINDIVLRINWWASKLGMRVARKHGDVPTSEKAKRLKKVPHILVTTPESLEIDLDWASKFRGYYKNVKWVIVDEVHELVQSKRGVQLSILLERLKRITGRDLQIIGLSATVSQPEIVADFLFGSSKRERAILELESKKPIEIELEYVDDSSENAWVEAAKIIHERVEPPSLVFVNSRFTAERLYEVLEKLGMQDILVHHSSVSKHVRSSAEKLLREGRLTAIVCTKTLELGIDIGDVKKVVQFRPPGNVSTLLQRIGRSGHRIDNVSRGVVVNVGVLELLESLATSLLAVRGEMEKPKIFNKPLDVLARGVMGMCMQEPGITAEEVYRVIKGAYPFRDLKYEELLNVIKYLVDNGVLTREGEGYKLGSTFFKIWSFNHDLQGKKWWSREFSEFFSTISVRDSFSVRYKGKSIGDVDSYYVYRFLRVGDSIRLSGRLWRVVEIDDNLMRVEVVPSEDSSGEVPMWRGEGVRRSRLLSEEVGEVLEKIRSRNFKLPRNVQMSINTLEVLKKFTRLQGDSKVPLPTRGEMIVERYGDETFFLYWMGQDTAETLAQIISYIISSSKTLNVATKSSFAGFSVKARDVDPLKVLLSLEPERISELLERAVERSPLTYAVLKEVQVSFGKTGKVDPYRDRLLFEEAKKQAITLFFDAKGAVEFLEKIKRGDIRVIEVRGKGLSPLAKMISSLPPQKPWVRDASITLVKTLEGSAFTVDELSEILELPPKTIENMLKELRKPESRDRVFQFLDVDLGEWRWGLVKDVDAIFSSEEFRESFLPYDITEAFMLMLKPESGESYYTKYFTPKEILESMEEFVESLPIREAYEVKVMPLYDSLLKSLAPKYYYVGAKIIPYIALNGSAFLQKLKLTS